MNNLGEISRHTVHNRIWLLNILCRLIHKTIVVTNTNSTYASVDSLSTTNVLCCRHDGDILSTVLLLQLVPHNKHECTRGVNAKKHDDINTFTFFGKMRMIRIEPERCFKTPNLWGFQRNLDNIHGPKFLTVVIFYWWLVRAMYVVYRLFLVTFLEGGGSCARTCWLTCRNVPHV